MEESLYLKPAGMPDDSPEIVLYKSVFEEFGPTAYSFRYFKPLWMRDPDAEKVFRDQEGNYEQISEKEAERLISLYIRNYPDMYKTYLMIYGHEHNEPVKMELDVSSMPAEVACLIGNRIENGTGGFKRDYKTAMKLYKAAAEKGNETAVNNIGWLYENGFGVKKNIREAERLFRKAAGMGSTVGMVNLGNLFEDREEYEEAFRWYSKAALLGDRKAQFNCANCYHFGYGVEQNYQIAYAMFKHLRRKGYTEKINFYLGLYAMEGFAEPKNYRKAFRYFADGAESGDSFCFTELGVLYAKGLGVRKNLRASFEMYREAAHRGDTLAWANLGYAYESGEGTDPDLEKAVACYRKGADQGEVHCLEAMTRLKKENK